jgi:cold-inducible RNA-binding protein
MSKNPRLFLANLPYSATEDDIREFLGTLGVLSVQIATDRDTGRSRGFAFVDLESVADLRLAIDNLNETEMQGRPVYVSEAHEKKNRGDSRNRNDRRPRER